MKSEKVILHVDLNNFFASVELTFSPHLAGVPLVIGGDEDKRHGIVLAKNNIAKKAGIVTGEPLVSARQKISGLVVMPTRRDEYIKFSQKAREIYEQYSDCVEDFGIDECWIDVTGSQKLFGDGKQIADEIRQRLKSELGLTASVGVSFCKIFAKLGSDYKKPDATTVITRENYKKLLWPLQATDMMGVGRKIGAKLAKVGICTIGDLAMCDKEYLIRVLGKWGADLHIKANGLDEEIVKKSYFFELPKSVGNSTTTTKDVKNLEDAMAVFASLAASVAKRMRAQDLVGDVVSISVRRADDLKWSGVQHKIQTKTSVAKDILEVARKLFEENHACVPFCFRSLGLSVAGVEHLGYKKEKTQKSFFDANAKEKDKQFCLEQAIDNINKKFGKSVIKQGSVKAKKELFDGEHGSLLDHKGT